MKRWIMLIFIAGLVIGGIVFAWVTLLGPALSRANSHTYNTSPQHLQAVAREFSDDCVLLSQTQELLVRKAIEQDIDSVASTVDLSKVALPQPTRTCINNAIQDIGH